MLKNYTIIILILTAFLSCSNAGEYVQEPVPTDSSSSSSSSGSVVDLRWNLASRYGISQAGFNAIIQDARDYFATNPDTCLVVEIDAGTHNIGGNGSHGIDLSAGLDPGLDGRFIIEGAGMDQTTLVFTEISQAEIYARDLYRTTFRDMHMTRDRYTVTQGNVISITQGEILIDLHDGFPGPLELWKDWAQGRYFRRYTISTTDPQVIQDNNAQIPWGWCSGAAKMPVLVSGDTWRFYLNNSNLTITNYVVGDLIGIKSKFEGDTFWMTDSGDILFENIRWTHSTRGVARGGSSSLIIRGCRVDRGDPINGQVPCMSSPSGGPQMNQLSTQGDPTATNMIYEDYFCDSPGDDCAAFFNVNGGLISNCILRNSFARGIYLTTEALNIHITGTIINNNPVMKEPDPTWYWDLADGEVLGYYTLD